MKPVYVGDILIGHIKDEKREGKWLYKIYNAKKEKLPGLFNSPREAAQRLTWLAQTRIFMYAKKQQKTNYPP